jgi:hypothetical protein
LLILEVNGQDSVKKADKIEEKCWNICALTGIKNHKSIQ